MKDSGTEHLDLTMQILSLLAKHGVLMSSSLKNLLLDQAVRSFREYLKTLESIETPVSFVTSLP